MNSNLLHWNFVNRYHRCVWDFLIFDRKNVRRRKFALQLHKSENPEKEPLISRQIWQLNCQSQEINTKGDAIRVVTVALCCPKPEVIATGLFISRNPCPFIILCLQESQKRLVYCFLSPETASFQNNEECFSLNCWSSVGIIAAFTSSGFLYSHSLQTPGVV